MLLSACSRRAASALAVSARAATTAAPAAAAAAGARSSSGGAGRKVLIGLGVVGATAVVGGCLANSVLLGPAIRLLRFSGVEIDFDEVRGTLCYPSTKLEFTNLHLRRQVVGAERDFAASFDLRVAKAQIESLHFVKGVAHLGVVALEGMTGSIETAPWSPPLPPLVMAHLRVTGAQLSVRALGQTHAVPVRIDRLESGPEGFCLPEVPASLAGSAVRCAVGSGAIEVTPRRAVRVQTLELAVLAPLIPPGNVLELLSGGSVDLAVTTNWRDAFGQAFVDASAAHPAYVDCEMRVVLRNFAVRADAAQGGPVAQALGAFAMAGLTTYLQRHSRELSFTVPVRVPWEALAQVEREHRGQDQKQQATALAALLFEHAAVGLVAQALGAVGAKALAAWNERSAK